LISDRRRAKILTACGVLPALVCLEVFALSVSSEDLIVRRSSDQIRVTAPRLHFLTGKSLQRLRDGAIVPFDFQLSIAAGSKGNVVERTVERFMVSYDLWQEKFRIVRISNMQKSSATLSANAAESWCLEHLLIQTSRLPVDKDLWARLEVRSAEPREQATALNDPGLSITTLIELFSRPHRTQQDHAFLETGPFHLADLKQ